MPNYSQYKKLELPISMEKYDINVVNKNNQVIDSEFHKLDLKNQSQDNLLATKESLNKEIERAIKQETDLQNTINSEKTRATNAESDISNNLLSEINRAMSVEQNIINTIKINQPILDDVNDKKHTHENKSILDTITSVLIDKWNSAVTHISDTIKHITSIERINWNNAYTHSTSAHAPSGAEVNQNAFSNVKVGTTTIAADSKTDTIELVAGNNITLTPDATNDKITISSSGDNNLDTINAENVNFKDEKNAEEKVGAINGITSDLNCEDESIAASMTALKQINDSLNNIGNSANLIAYTTAKSSKTVSVNLNGYKFISVFMHNPASNSIFEMFTIPIILFKDKNRIFELSFYDGIFYKSSVKFLSDTSLLLDATNSQVLDLYVCGII